MAGPKQKGSEKNKRRRRRAEATALPPIGARVRMRFGLGDVTATVIEHRGKLGVGGAKLLRVRFWMDRGADPIETEVALQDVTVVGSAA